MNNGTTFSLLQNLTGTPPTLPTEGQPLSDLVAITPVLETSNPAVQTLSGAGTLRCYIWDSLSESVGGSAGVTGVWMRLPSLDLSVTATGVPRQAWEGMDVVGPRAGRVLWVPDGVTVSAGTQVKVYQLGYNPEMRY